MISFWLQEGAKGSTIGEADIDLLKKMEPLKGQVEWSTWGSKLESIFQPVFDTLPSLVVSIYIFIYVSALLALVHMLEQLFVIVFLFFL